MDYFDNKTTGLMLEVRPSGTKQFFYRYSDERGRKQREQLGSAEVLTLAQARRKARDIATRITLGDDPRQSRQLLRAIPTLNAFVQDHYLPFVKEHKRSWRTDETMLRCHILPALGTLPLDEITTEHVNDVVRKMKEKGYAGGTYSRAIVLLRSAFNRARKWKIAGATENPTTGVATSPQVNCERYLTPEETARLVAAIEVDENTVAADAIMLLLLTGARRNEITQAKWEHVDLDRSSLLVPMSKSGKPRRITLSGKAVALLQSIQPIEGQPYIFPSARTGRPSSSIFYPFDRIRRRAGLKDVRLHDLRHSFASTLVNNGVALYTVQKLLGHTQPRTTQRYAHLAPETLLNAAELLSDMIPNKSDSQPTSQAPSNVLADE